jgi:hypothetical protein
MRKITIASIVVLLLLGAGLYLVRYKPLRPDIRTVNELSRKWMEDLQFKDFRSSGLYHHKLDRDRVDIGRALERLFMVKPEMLDIRDYRIVSTDVDSTGKRARVKVKSRFKRLNKDKEPQEADLMLYWMKRHPDCPIGATCPDGTCHNEFGKPVHKTDDEDDSGPKHKAPEPEEATDETYSCDPSADRQWFMNLDSTLKEKEYERN